MKSDPTKTDRRYGRDIEFEGKFVTKRQREFLEALESLWREKLGPPSWRELTKKIGAVSPKSIERYIMMFEESGLVERASTGNTDRESSLRGLSRTVKTSRMKVGFGTLNGQPGRVIFWGNT